MSEKEYIVSLHKNVDYDAFNAEMIASTGAGAIPNRSAPVANARPGSLRNTHYMLTAEEAASLREDTRVYGVEIPPQDRDDIQIGFNLTQVGNFNKTTLDRGDFINWGLKRINSASNIYGAGESAVGGYDYTLDGGNVDIVIQDSGLQIDHPEFQDSSGASRVQEINWYTESGLSGTQSSNHYRDYDGHGTHVAGIAVGKTYGFAKGARIYALKVAGLEGTGDSSTGISVTDCFDVIKEWHKAKPVDPSTGYKRPTIVNMSWGYGRSYTSASEINYRGTSYTGAAIDSANERLTYGLVPYLVSAGTYQTNVRIASVDTDVQEMIDEGIHVVIAAGNRSHKIDVDGGDDYNNYAVLGGVTTYYHRGSSPFSDGAHLVGNIDSNLNADGKEQKAVSSETGPGVSIYAPGTNIMSATSTTNRWGEDDGPYPGSESYLITNISGTSMAAPQIAGALSLYLDINPGATPAQAKTFLETQAKADLIHTNSNGYSDYRSLQGSPNRFGFNKFNAATAMVFGAPQAAEASANATYSLGVNSSNVNEGDTVIFTLTTTNVDNGVQIPYTITGIDSNDIQGTLTGQFSVSNNTATATVVILEDVSTEGGETMTLALDFVDDTEISVAIADTSVAPVATYSLTRSSATVNEGDTVTFTLTTTNVTNGTTVPYTITGIQDADIVGNLTGNFTVTSNSATLAIETIADATTEGSETLTVTLDGLGVTLPVTVLDTSESGDPTYTLSTSASTVNEGGTVTYTLVTQNVADSTNVPYTITGVSAADLVSGSLTGNFAVNSNTAQVAIQIVEDSLTEGTETLTLTLNNGADSAAVNITDTSLAPTYTLSSSVASVNEGSSFTITLNTTDVADATSIPYTVSGVSSADLSGGSLTGNFVIASGTATATFNLALDLATEGVETFTLALDSGAASVQVTINDTSQAPAATYSLSSSTSSVNEGSSFTITLATTNVDAGTNIPYTITGVTSADISSASLTGNFVVGTTDSIIYTASNDVTTEGTETFTMTLDGLSESTAVSILDTSQTPAFTPDHTITVTNSGNNYTLSGTDTNGAVSGSQPSLAFNNGDKVRFSVNASTSTAHPFYIKTVQGAGTSNQASGVDGQGTVQLDWTIGSTGTFYYQCSIHGGMNNTITVS